MASIALVLVLALSLTLGISKGSKKINIITFERLNKILKKGCLNFPDYSRYKESTLGKYKNAAVAVDSTECSTVAK